MKRRILFIDQCAQPSGAELALLALCTRLTRSDAVVAFGEDGALVNDFRRAGVAAHVVPLSEDLRRSRVDARVPSIRRLRRAADEYVSRIVELVGEEGASAVCTNSLQAHVAMRLGRPRPTVPWLLYLREPITRPNFGLASTWLLRALLSTRAHALIANSIPTSRTLRHGNRFVVPPAIELGRLTTRSTQDRAEDRPVVFGALGSLSPAKGQDRLIAALADPQLNEVSVRFAGQVRFRTGRGYERYLRSVASESTVNGRVTFDMHVDDVDVWLDAVDVLVVPSRIHEGFGQSIVQGLAKGLPVVAPKDAGAATVIRPGESGVVFDRRSDDALVGAMVAAMSRNVRRGAAIHGPKDVRCFDPDRVAELFESVLDQALSSRASSSDPCTRGREVGK